jgi:HrpA-like RNA helicase
LGDSDEAERLWKELIDTAKSTRLRTGTITLQELWSRQRVQFGLRQHPNFERDWETLSSITSNYKSRIETNLPSGYSLPRTADKTSFKTAVTNNAVTVVFGEPGCGKSALVKSVLDADFPSWASYGADRAGREGARRHVFDAGVFIVHGPPRRALRTSQTKSAIGPWNWQGGARSMQAPAGE